MTDRTDTGEAPDSIAQDVADLKIFIGQRMSQDEMPADARATLALMFALPSHVQRAMSEAEIIHARDAVSKAITDAVRLAAPSPTQTEAGEA